MYLDPQVLKRIFCFLLLLVLSGSGCKEKQPPKQSHLAPERLNNLTILSTPPQKWTLNISSGQKTKDTLQAFNINIKSDNWTFKSPVATQEKDIYTLAKIEGLHPLHQIRLLSTNNRFSLSRGELSGQELQLKALHGQWELKANTYQSQSPWTHIQLQSVQGTFQR